MCDHHEPRRVRTQPDGCIAPMSKLAQAITLPERCCSTGFARTAILSRCLCHTSKARFVECLRMIDPNIVYKTRKSIELSGQCYVNATFIFGANLTCSLSASADQDKRKENEGYDESGQESEEAEVKGWQEISEERGQEEQDHQEELKTSECTFFCGM